MNLIFPIVFLFLAEIFLNLVVDKGLDFAFVSGSFIIFLNYTHNGISIVVITIKINI